MRNVLADLCVESEAATSSAMRLARSYDEVAAGDEEAARVPPARQRRAQVLDLQARALARGRVPGVPRRQRLRRGVGHAAPLPRGPAGLDLGGLGQRPVPRRAAGDGQEPRPRSRPSSPRCWRAPAPSRGSTPTSARSATRSPATSRRSRPAPAASSRGWRSPYRPRCSSATATPPSPTPSAPRRLSGDWGHAFGTLPAGTDFSSIIERHSARPDSQASRQRSPTCSAVMTPERRPSASTAIRAPKRRRAWLREQRVERGVVADLEGAVVVLEQVGDEGGGTGGLGDLVGFVAHDQAEEAVGSVDDREPGPAVAEEVLVESLLDAELAGDRDRLAVHHVGDAKVADPARDRRLHRGGLGRAVDDEADQGQPDAAEDVAHGDQQPGRRR